ncbi:hypothetical protein C8Q77DRAFT_1158902 [Trametes polyzona]|nr:hypothetical protein C8Q77DRAFT_1158902 [Trametes polyzona]
MQRVQQRLTSADDGDPNSVEPNPKRVGTWHSVFCQGPPRKTYALVDVTRSFLPPFRSHARWF